jgi:hypothetical protein
MPARLMSKPVGVKLAAEPTWTSVQSGPGMTRMLACSNQMPSYQYRVCDGRGFVVEA